MTPMQSSYGNNYPPNFYQPQPEPAPVNYEQAPPRPYSWKTDEFQIPPDNKQSKNKPINRVQPLGNFQAPTTNAGLQTFQQSQAAVSHNFHCPRCSSQLFPRVTRQISTAGWVVFAVLLVTFFPLFWVGFLIKEDVRTCPVCNFRYQ